MDGVCFETKSPPSKGDSLRFELRPIEGPEVTARGKVLHVRRSARTGFFLVGMEIGEIDEQDAQKLLILIDTINRMEKDLSQK
jgi:hypothetical protein